MWLLWTAVGLVGLLVLFGLVLWFLGRRLPEGHVVSATLRLARPPGEVFTALADTAGIPSWDTGVSRVERVPDLGGHETWRWTMGRNRMLLSITRREPPRTLTSTIADEAKFFSGSWTYEIEPDGAGSRVLLTEHGRVHAAIPRAMMHYLPRVADPAMYLLRHLARLAAKFGEAPRLERGPYRSVS